MSYPIIIVERTDGIYDVRYGNDESGEPPYENQYGLTSNEVFDEIANIDLRDTPSVFVMTAEEYADHVLRTEALDEGSAMDLDEAWDFFDPES